MEDEEIVGILHFKPAYRTLVEIRSSFEERSRRDHVNMSFSSKEGSPVLIIHSLIDSLGHPILSSGLYAFKQDSLWVEQIEIDDDDFRMRVKVRKSWFKHVGYSPKECF